MTKKQMGAIAGAIVALLSSMALALSSHRTAEISDLKATNFGERVRAVEVRLDDSKERLERIENKLDKLLSK